MATDTPNHHANQRGQDGINAARSPLLNQVVTISGVGGYVFHDIANDNNRNSSSISTQFSRRDRPSCCFLVERAPPAVYGEGNNYVTFSCHNSAEKLYLTQHLYGDQARTQLSDILLDLTSQQLPLLLPELVPNIVDYAVEPATGSFEGEGFHYAPMTAEPARGRNRQDNNTRYPSWQQIFILEEAPPVYNRANISGTCIRSFFGNYWRSEHWNHVISQSKNRLADETFYLRPVPAAHGAGANLRGSATASNNRRNGNNNSDSNNNGSGNRGRGGASNRIRGFLRGRGRR